MKNHTKKILVLAAGIFLGLQTLGAQETLLRYGLFIGANQGGPGREPLRYANSDADALASVMQELGGLSAGETKSLRDPSSGEVLSTLSALSRRISEDHRQAKRVEFIFYYSGHSDEEGLLLNREKLKYPALREALNNLNADVRIAILDSCSSGSFTRLKGGVKAAPFLVDASSELKGHAYLTSSSENEASQESDRIGGSFFTYYLISGLRGAADTTGDNRVTLNEIYQHAFKETVSRTESTVAGPQHPSYDIQLSGTGDLVLTDLNTQNSRMILGKDLDGRVFVRTAQGQLMAEVQKKPGEQIPLALGAGDYVVSLQNDRQYLTGRQTLAAGDMKILTQRDLRPAGRESNRVRGNTLGEEVVEIDPTEEETTIVVTLPKLPRIPYLPFFNPEDPAEEQLPAQIEDFNFNIGLLPGIELHPGFNKRVEFSAHGLISQTAETKGIQLAGLLSFSGKLEGIQASGIGSINTGKLEGIQAGGIFSIAANDVKGMQLAGTFNILPGTMDGFQSAGVFNIVGSHIRGFQGAGTFNIGAGTAEGFQGAGIFNIVAGSFKGFQGAGIFNRTGDFEGFQAAGILNVADSFKGFQAGLINRTTRMEGFQAGLLNISGHVEGLSLGLLTIADNSIYRINYMVDSLGYAWNSYQWGANGFFTSITAGVPKEQYLQDGSEMVRGYTIGSLWGDSVWSSLETGQFWLPGQDMTNPWNLADNSGHFVGLKYKLGVRIANVLTVYGGYGLNLHFPGWTTASPLNTGSSFAWFDSGYDISYRGGWFLGGSLGW